MVVLEEKIFFWLLLAIPVVLLLYFLNILWKRRTQKKFATAVSLERLSPNKSKFKPVLKVILWSLAIAFLTMAMVNPKIGSKMETVKREGIDIVFAIDVSKSMLAEDIAPNRLEKSKQLVTQIINNLTSDRIGIIAYAGSAFPQLPITTDYGSAKLFLQAMNTDMVSSQGTAINEAIELAQTYYNDESETNRVLFLISDGRPQDRGYSREGVEKEYAVHDTKKALDEAKEKQITAFCLTVDKNGHDYLKTMCDDMGYEVLDDIYTLPQRLLYLYRRLTM